MWRLRCWLRLVAKLDDLSGVVSKSRKFLDPSLPPGAKRRLDAFCGSANKNVLHQLNWERFYLWCGTYTLTASRVLKRISQYS
jgi:hypothetical protein